MRYESRKADAPEKRFVRGKRAHISSADSVNKEGDVFRKASVSRLRAFRSAVWKYWRENGRHDLPWRRTKDPYKILVSEVMLQQTQVPRVVEKYKEFLRVFPNISALANAPLSEVLKVWNGLGYNRRAKHLHDAARRIVETHQGVVPKEYLALRAIPGIGMYTANAVRVFAFDEPEVLVETNVRTAIVYHFFPNKGKVEDFDIKKIAAAAAEEHNPREWHSALFDYGAYLKAQGIRLNDQSARYSKQSKFEGSLRQIRGAILRELHNGPSALETLPFKKGKIQSALASLARDGLIAKQKEKWRIR